MMGFNSFRLWRLERDFAALAHPVESKFLKRQKMVGLVAGNGNHCDFFVAELHSHDGNQQKTREFYRSIRVAVPNHDAYQESENGTQATEIELLPSPLPPKYHWRYHHVDPWDLSALAGRKNLYIVLIHNSGESWAWDSALGACG